MVVPSLVNNSPAFKWSDVLAINMEVLLEKGLGCACAALFSDEKIHELQHNPDSGFL